MMKTPRHTLRLTVPWRAVAMLVPALLFLVGCVTVREDGLRQDLAQAQAAMHTGERGMSGHVQYEFEPRMDLPDLEREATLADCLRHAALANPALRSAFEDWRAAIERIPQARALPDPRFSYAYYINEVETRVGPQQHRAAVMQMFPWPSKLEHRSRRAFHLARAQKHGVDARKLQLFYQVRKAYFEYWYLARAIDLHRENLDLLKNLEGALRVRYKVSEAGHPELIRAQVEAGTLEDRIESLLGLRSALSARLNAAMGRKGDTLLPWPKDEPRERGNVDLATLVAGLDQANPEHLAMQDKIGAAEAAAALARDSSRPDFGVGLTYIQTDPRGMAGIDDDGKDPVLLMFEMTLPIWTGKYSAERREAAANLQAARSNREDLLHRIEADLRVAHYRYEDAGRKARLYRDTLLPKTEQALEATLAAFTAGNAGYLDVIDAERQMLELHLLAARARVDRAIHAAELEMLAGRELDSEQ